MFEDNLTISRLGTSAALNGCLTRRQALLSDPRRWFYGEAKSFAERKNVILSAYICNEPASRGGKGQYITVLNKNNFPAFKF